MKPIRIASKEYPVMEIDEEAGTIRGIDVTLRHRKHGTRAQLIAMMHVAMPGFYRGVEETIRSINGAVPLMEGTPKPTINKDTEPHVRDMFRIRRYLHKMQTQLLPVDGKKLIEQHHWQRKAFPTMTADVTMEDMANFVQQKDGDLARLRSILGAMAIRKKEAHCKISPQEFVRKSAEMDAKFELMKGLMRFYPTGWALITAISRFREDHLLEGIASHTDEKHLIVPWGAMHIEPLVSRLTMNRDWKFEKDSLSYRTIVDANAAESTVNPTALELSPVLPDHQA